MESEEFLQGFYQLSPEDQQFLKTLISDYTAGKVTDQEFTDRINAQKEKRRYYGKENQVSGAVLRKHRCVADRREKADKHQPEPTAPAHAREHKNFWQAEVPL